MQFRFSKYLILIVSFVCILMINACEKEFIPEIPVDVEQYVIEGYVEAGEDAPATYVLITKSIPFFGELTPDQLTNLFVKDAKVTVSDGEKTVELLRICWSDLGPDIQAQIATTLGIVADSVTIDICAYLDILNTLDPQIGKTYDLRVEIGEEVLTASTTIPMHVPLDSLKFIQPPGNEGDTLAELRSFINDPAGIANYYRYFTEVNGQGLIPGFNSVVDDAFFDGQSFEFPISKSESRTDPPDPEVFGLFYRGDSVRIKWANIDAEHYEFWNTLEFNAVNQGPFSSYTRISSNINGGLGIWGGYSSSQYNLIVPE